VNTGVKIDLKTGYSQVIATSKVHSSDTACCKGIESVRRNVQGGNLHRLTIITG